MGNFQKCSTLYFQKKAVCFAKQKVKDSKILLSFYIVLVKKEVSGRNKLPTVKKVQTICGKAKGREAIKYAFVALAVKP